MLKYEVESPISLSAVTMKPEPLEEVRS